MFKMNIIGRISLPVFTSLFPFSFKLPFSGWTADVAVYLNSRYRGMTFRTPFLIIGI